MSAYAERVSTLRGECLARKAIRQSSRVLWSPAGDIISPVVDAESLKSSEGLPWQIRRGLRSKARMEACLFEMDSCGMLAGRVIPHAPPEKGKLEEALAYLKGFPEAGGQSGHCELALDRLFERGVSGLIEDMQAKSSSIAEPERKDALESFALALQGFSRMILNAAESVEAALSSEKVESRKLELEVVMNSCRRVASAPPETFMDAIHLTWFANMAVNFADGAALVVPGHLDRRLIDYYKREGIDREKALFLIENLYILINDYVPDGLAMSIMVGGRDRHGDDITNDLSHLCLEALRRTALCYPTVGVCWHRGTPDTLNSLAVELISKGYTTPAFFGDETIQTGLRSYGVPTGEACDYINSTCVEITPCGSSNVWVASPYFSLCGILLEELSSGTDYASFDGFVEKYFMRLSKRIAEAADAQNRHRDARARQGGKPLQSAFTRDCIERATDIDKGGARYNWVECSFVGLANLADSLMVIKGEVFDKKEMDVPALKRVLDSNFEGHGELRMKFLNSHPKYGVGNGEVDALAGMVIDKVSKECAKHRMSPDNSPFVPGVFCWMMHERLGGECGATPDGRLAKTPFADGAGPAQGRETKGPTAAILSASSWDHSKMIGGSALNMKFDKSLFRDRKAVESLKGLILTYLKRGGFEVQVNVVDHGMLERAKRNPESYRDLVVRIGGFTDYFTRLSPQMQDELISRTSYLHF